MVFGTFSVVYRKNLRFSIQKYVLEETSPNDQIIITFGLVEKTLKLLISVAKYIIWR